MLEYKLQITQTIIRVFLGTLFFFQAYDKVFRVRISGVVNAFIEDAEHLHIHKPWVIVVTYLTSFVELIGGLLLITGLFTNYVLVALGVDLLLVCFAFSLIRPMWDLQHVFPRLVMVSALLLMPNEYNQFSLDYLLNLK